VQKKTVRRAEPGNNSVEESQSWRVESGQELPDVPVLPGTLLRLDLEVQERCVDLRAMSRLVLSDLGATLQILRLAGTTYGSAEGRPARIEDCISDLGLDACLEAVSVRTIPRDDHYNTIAEIWSHSLEIAQDSMQVAEETLDVNPDEAYLVGLMHSIGMLPAALGWTGSNGGASDGIFIGYQLAKAWSLPHPVVAFFAEMHLAARGTQWQQIVRSAHNRAIRSTVECPFEREIRPLLRRAM
jgi:HD-like signal output (HDOD) protein